MKTKARRQPHRKPLHEVLPPLDPQLRFTVDQAASYLKQSRGKIYRDIAAGKLKTILDGRRRYIPGTEILRRSTLPQRRRAAV